MYSFLVSFLWFSCSLHTAIYCISKNGDSVQNEKAQARTLSLKKQEGEIEVLCSLYQKKNQTNKNNIHQINGWSF